MKVLNWAKKNILNIILAAAKFEKDVKTKEYGSNSIKETKQEAKSLLNDLINGELTEDVKMARWVLYKVLTNAQNAVAYSDGENVIVRNNKLSANRIKVDSHDTHPVDFCVMNDSISMGILDVMNRIGDSEEVSLVDYTSSIKDFKAINIKRELPSKFNLENYIKKLIVRNIDGSDKLLEFYVSKYPDEYNKTNKLFVREIEKIIHSNKKSTTLEISSVDFVTYNGIGVDDFLQFEYEIVKFDKIIEYNGFYVIKFFAKIKINGAEIFNQYLNEEMERRYISIEKKSDTIQ